jgi:hypothetical protein
MALTRNTQEANPATALIIVQCLLGPVHPASLLLSLSLSLSIDSSCVLSQVWALACQFLGMEKAQACCFYLFDCFMLETDVPFFFLSFT